MPAEPAENSGESHGTYSGWRSNSFSLASAAGSSGSAAGARGSRAAAVGVILGTTMNAPCSAIGIGSLSRMRYPTKPPKASNTTARNANSPGGPSQAMPADATDGPMLAPTP